MFCSETVHELTEATAGERRGEGEGSAGEARLFAERNDLPGDLGIWDGDAYAVSDGDAKPGLANGREPGGFREDTGV